MSTASTARAAQGQAAKADLLTRLQSKKPQSATYDVVIDPAPVEALAVAQRKLAYANATGEGVAVAQAAADEAEAAAREAVVTLHLQGVPRPVYEALLLEHPPTEEQKADGQTYNDDTFAPALVARCIVDPETAENPLSVEDVAGLFDKWNQGEVAQVYLTAIGVCTQARNPNLPKGSGTTRG
jgi:hypothetical protein